MNPHIVFPFHDKETYEGYVALIKQKRSYLTQIIKDTKLDIKDLQRRNVTTLVHYEELADLRVELHQWTQLRVAAKKEAERLYNLSNNNIIIKNYIDFDYQLQPIFQKAA